MANFNVHLGVAALGSSLCAAIAKVGHMIPDRYLITLVFAGIVGGLLPDIDLDHSLPARMFFSFLGIVGAFVAWAAIGDASVLTLLVVWAIVYFAIRHPLYRAFEKLTHHRGIFHSLLAAVFFGVLTVDLCSMVLGERPALSWLTGVFVTLGYLMHLVLDEIYSVDIRGEHIVKRSFLTAIKPIDFHAPWASILMAFALIFAFAMAPSYQALTRNIDVASFVKNRVLPGWMTGFKTVTVWNDKNQKADRSPPH